MRHGTGMGDSIGLSVSIKLTPGKTSSSTAHGKRSGTQDTISISHAKPYGTHVLVVSRHNRAAGDHGTIGGRRAMASAGSKVQRSCNPHVLPCESRVV